MPSHCSDVSMEKLAKVTLLYKRDFIVSRKFLLELTASLEDRASCGLVYADRQLVMIHVTAVENQIMYEVEGQR